MCWRGVNLAQLLQSLTCRVSMSCSLPFLSIDRTLCCGLVASTGSPHEPRRRGSHQGQEVRGQRLDPPVRLRQEQPLGLHGSFRLSVTCGPELWCRCLNCYGKSSSTSSRRVHPIFAAFCLTAELGEALYGSTTPCCRNRSDATQRFAYNCFLSILKMNIFVAAGNDAQIDSKMRA
jgi:hypothetical protein